mgnify:CR=1 FL=1
MPPLISGESNGGNGDVSLLHTRAQSASHVRLAVSSRHPEGVFSPYASILLQYSFAKLHINFAVLR